MTPTKVYDQLYEYLSWQEMGEIVFELSKKILKKGQQYDRVIALAKGGLTHSRALVDFLKVPELSSIQIQFYAGIAKTGKTPVITQSLPVSIKNERVLIFDDVVDKGDTLKMAAQYLSYHGAKEISTAVMVSKPWSTFAADFSAHTSESWIIFPHEVRESIGLLKTMWGEKGDSAADIRKNLIKIGIPKAEVEFFLDLP